MSVKSKYDIEVIVGENAGFCYGVKRAVDGAEELLKEKQNLYCLGEIVHNKEVVSSLCDKGLNFIDDIKDTKGDTLIRAHGVSCDIYKYAQDNNIKLYDFTCPKVLAIHKVAEKYRNKGYFIILLGSSTHPENIGTISFCGKNSYIALSTEDVDKALEKLYKSKCSKLLVIAQTTYSVNKFFKIKKYIEDKVDKNIEVVIKNTICQATEIRQEEVSLLSKKVDLMIIIGGKNSSNTKKIYDIAKENVKTICIETKDDIEISLKEYKRIGIMAGASTPRSSIDEVVVKIGSDYSEKKFNEKNI